ncbi:MAG: alpha-glucan family phosphorylase [Pseudomonadota bacterium]
MKPVRTVFVEPRLPKRIEKLWEVAHNTRWSWDSATSRLFMDLDPDLWKASGENPVRMLGLMDPARLEELARDDSFVHNAMTAGESLCTYLADKSTWFHKQGGDEGEGLLTAYFSAEFGIADCVQIFSGGLGILAGDHLKSSSDMGVPLVGIGLAYQHGYFHQYLSPDGWQQELYPASDFHTMPMRLVMDGEQGPLTLHIPMEGRSVRAWLHEVRVGRNLLYLLDTNHPENSPADRSITSDLYGGDQEMRIRQEIILGMGGVIALEALDLKPRVYHINEGHAAFLALERIRSIIRTEKVDYDTAREIVGGQLVFTTHTPVPAGIDVFPEELVTRYLGAYAGDLFLTPEQLLSLGRERPGNAGFNMAVLALRLSTAANGVSRLHGEVSRRMWSDLWPGLPPAEVPIGSVTNGVHLQTWVSPDMASLLDRYLSPSWRAARDGDIWSRLASIPDEEIWRTHERRRERLVAFARGQAAAQFRSQGASPDRISEARDLLDPDALTVGFARRFAPYKRATLLLRDPERLVQLLTNKDRPLQILFAGKAHPKDQSGKDLVRQIVQFSRRPEVAGTILFLEDYDIEVARYLVQGVDVWLNNPRVPKEASGTSGMKAAANGALQVSTRDGWWAEVADEGIGWTIGRGEIYPVEQHAYQDEIEARLLYDVLEKEVAPMFYDRGRDGLPRRWVEMMRASMGVVCRRFDSCRMVREYVSDYYLPAANRYHRLWDADLARAKDLAAWRRKVIGAWGAVRADSLEWAPEKKPAVGGASPVSLTLYLGELSAKDVCVEMIHGRVLPDSTLEETGRVHLNTGEDLGQGRYRFSGTCPFDQAGRTGFAFRVVPRHADLASPYSLGLIKIIDEI